MEGKNSKISFFKVLVEIAIVVVGIFIAFQLNSWNENRNIKYEEISSLKLIKNDLITEKSFFKFINADFKNGVNYLERILNGNISNVDSLVFYLEKEFFHPQLNSSYINLKFGGNLNIISNVTLKNSIINFYEANYGYFDAFAKSHQAFVYNNIRDYNIKNVKIDQNLILNDSEIKRLLLETELNNLINYQIYTFNLIRERLNGEMINRLVEDVENEINLLE